MIIPDPPPTCLFAFSHPRTVYPPVTNITWSLGSLATSPMPSKCQKSVTYKCTGSHCCVIEWCTPQSYPVLCPPVPHQWRVLLLYVLESRYPDGNPLGHPIMQDPQCLQDARCYNPRLLSENKYILDHHHVEPPRGPDVTPLQSQ